MTTMEQAYEQAADEIAAEWGETSKPCRYGHLDCSDRSRGRCSNEATDARTAEILARGAMEAAKKKTYRVQILAGVVYVRDIEAENLEEALEIAEEFDPEEYHFYTEGEPERTILIEHGSGVTAFGFGTTAAQLGTGRA